MRYILSVKVTRAVVAEIYPTIMLELANLLYILHSVENVAELVEHKLFIKTGPALPNFTYRKLGSTTLSV